jgi:hypothetical protein
VPEPYPYVRCPLCSVAIALPDSTLIDPTATRRSWPSPDWRGCLLCPYCRRAFDCPAELVKLWKAGLAEDRWHHRIESYYKVGVACTFEGCGELATVFAPCQRIETALTLKSAWERGNREARKTKSKPAAKVHCSKGHALTNTISISSLIDVSRIW